MGGGPSIANTVTVVNDVVTKVITDTLQSASSQATAVQTLNIDCRDFPNSDDLQHCFTYFSSTGDPSVVQAVCGPEGIMTCGGAGITINGAINVDLDSQARSKAVNKINTSISNDVKSAIQQQANELDFGSAEENSLGVFTTAVTNIVENFIQNDFTSINQTQTINIKGTQLRVASLNAVLDLVKKNVLQNTVYIQAVNTLSNDVAAFSKQSSHLQGPLTILFYVFGIVVGGFFIFGIVLWIIKQNRK